MSESLDLIKIIDRFPDDESARSFLEDLRWPDGPVCPRCGSEKAYKLTARPTSRRPVRQGVYKCGRCRKQFTVTVGTIFEDSHIPLRKWLIAIHLMCASKKGISAHQLHRMLDVTYKSAWFMAHRIRYAMARPPLSGKLRGVVEADETYVGGKPRNRHVKHRRGRGAENKVPVVSLVERGGSVRSFPVDRVTGENLRRILLTNVAPGSTLMTDGYPHYGPAGRHFPDHQTVDHHSGEYVRGEAHVNTAEGYFSLLKRGIIGTYHHVGPQHLHRYTAEFDFRYNARQVPDGVRTMLAIEGAEGKRLTFKEPRG